MSVAIVVEHCASCPFAQGPPDDEPSDPWLCDALGAEDGETEPRELPKQQVVTGQWVDPPDWCPLRNADRLVTLRTR